MDYVEGFSLAEIIRDETLAPRDAALLVRTTAEAVHYAHEQGTVHRDLKPANILLDANRQPKVTDFGLAKMLGGLDDQTRAELTASGQILGTPSYMSPEQASGKRELVGPASDIYSLGAILYASLTGRAPFVADSPVDTLLQVMNKEPISPRDLSPSVPRDLETICLKCLTKEPHKRYGTAQELADDLCRFLEGRPVVARPVGKITKSIRWCARNRLVATLLSLSVFLLVGGTVASTYFALEANARSEEESKQRRRADETVKLLRAANQNTKSALDRESRAVTNMQAERDEARRQRQRAETLLYAAHLNAAKREVGGSRVQEARESLDRCRADIRGWEHDYLSAIVADRENEAATGSLKVHPSILRLPDELQHAAAIVISPNGSHAVAISGRSASGATSTRVPVLNLSTRTVTGWLIGHESRVTNAAYEPNGKCIVTGADDGSVKVWDAETFNELFELPSHEHGVTSLAFSPDGRQIVCGSGKQNIPVKSDDDVRLIVYDVQERTPLWQLDGHSGLVTTVAYSPDGQWIASGGFGNGVDDAGEVRLWDVQTGMPVFAVDAQPIAVTDVAFSADSQRLAVAGGLGVGEKEVLVLNVSTGESILSLADHRENLFSVAYSPDCTRIATLGGGLLPTEPRSVKLWDASTGIELLTLDVDTVLTQVVWHPANHSVLGVGRSNQRAAIVTFSAEQQQVLPNLIIRKGTDSAASSLKFIPEGRHIVSGGQYQVVHLWDVQNGEEVRPIIRHSKPIMGVGISKDGNRIASVSFDGLKVWDLKLDREVLSVDITGDNLHYYSVACSPDGQRLIVGGSRGHVQLWTISDDLQSSHFELLGHAGTVRGVAFSQDGSRVASAGSDKTVRVWDVKTGKQIQTLKAHTQVVTCVEFSPDGERLVSGSFDKTLRVWDIETGSLLAKLVGHDSSVLCVAFSQNGTRIASGGTDKAIRLWHAGSGELLATLTGHDGYVRSVSFSPDSSLIASSSGAEDMTIRVWPNPFAP